MCVCVCACKIASLGFSGVLGELYFPFLGETFLSTTYVHISQVNFVYMMIYLSASAGFTIRKECDILYP